MLSTLFKMVLLVLIVGVTAGAMLGGTDLANPITRSAEAEGIRIQNERSRRQDEIDLAYLEQRQQAELRYLVQRQQEELRYVQDRHVADLKQRELLGSVLADAIRAIGICLAGGIVCAAIILTLKKIQNKGVSNNQDNNITDRDASSGVLYARANIKARNQARAERHNRLRVDAHLAQSRSQTSAGNHQGAWEQGLARRLSLGPDDGRDEECALKLPVMMLHDSHN